MRLLDSGSSPTAEEFHYQYDGSGALLASGFAQTPATGYNPGTGNPYYNQTELPSTRARVIYDNGSGVNNLYYYWDTWNSGSYASQSITGFQQNRMGHPAIRKPMATCPPWIIWQPPTTIRRCPKNS